MNIIVLDVNAGAWKLETERGVIMDGDKSEHLLEAIPVMGCYCDMIGVRSFAGLTNREYDYAETVLHQFIKYSGKPVFAMETATVHPLQAFADLITIEENLPNPSQGGAIDTAGTPLLGRGRGRFFTPSLVPRLR
jgi:N-succinyl-L-ornithine transcarbamylase